MTPEKRSQLGVLEHHAKESVLLAHMPAVLHHRINKMQIDEITNKKAQEQIQTTK